MPSMRDRPPCPGRSDRTPKLRLRLGSPEKSPARRAAVPRLLPQTRPRVLPVLCASTLVRARNTGRPTRPRVLPVPCTCALARTRNTVCPTRRSGGRAFPSSAPSLRPRRRAAAPPRSSTPSGPRPKRPTCLRDPLQRRRTRTRSRSTSALGSPAPTRCSRRRRRAAGGARLLWKKRILFFWR